MALNNPIDGRELLNRMVDIWFNLCYLYWKWPKIYPIILYFVIS